MQALGLISQVKIIGNYGYDLFYFFEGSAVLYRAAELGAYIYILGLTIFVPSKTASLQEIPSARFGRSCLGRLASYI